MDDECEIHETTSSLLLSFFSLITIIYKFSFIELKTFLVSVYLQLIYYTFCVLEIFNQFIKCFLLSHSSNLIYTYILYFEILNKAESRNPET